MRLEGRTNEEKKAEALMRTRSVKATILRILRGGKQVPRGVLLRAAGESQAFCERAIRELIATGEVERVERGVYRRGNVTKARPKTLVDHWEAFCFGKAA